MKTSATAPVLPRLLYLGDVPVESSVAGSALIYRLLSNYPAPLCITETNLGNSAPTKRLPNTQYETANLYSKRLLYSRIRQWYACYLLLTQTRHVAELEKTAKRFMPEAILTVAHGFSWILATSLSRRLKVPLHLIIHDDWFALNPLPKFLGHYLQNLFQTIYRQSASRLCISSEMEKVYEIQYGAKGTVLYPTRAKDVQVFTTPAEHVGEVKEQLTIGYAGSVHVGGYRTLLGRLAAELNNMGGKLIIYSEIDYETAKRYGLDKSNVSIQKLLPYQQLINTLRRQADVLFTPMTFEPGGEEHMRLSFPSKLADYTAIGLPLLIWGPSFSAAVQWAHENPGVAELVTTEDTETLKVALKNLAGNPNHRIQLAKKALEKGEEYFSYTNGVEKFYSVLKSK